MKAEKGWYALDVFFNRVKKMAPILDEDFIEYYIPMKTFEVIHQGVISYEKRQIITSLLFIKCIPSYLQVLKEKYGDQFKIYTEVGKKFPYRIPEKEMKAFILVTSVEDQGLELLPNGTINCKVGDHVRVIDGIFKGAEGYIKRIKGKKRLIVSIEGVAVVATSYIPHCFLEKL